MMSHSSLEVAFHQLGLPPGPAGLGARARDAPPRRRGARSEPGDARARWRRPRIADGAPGAPLARETRRCGRCGGLTRRCTAPPVTLRLVTCAPGDDPSEAQEQASTALEPRLMLRGAGVADGGSLLACFAAARRSGSGSPGARLRPAACQRMLRACAPQCIVRAAHARGAAFCVARVQDTPNWLRHFLRCTSPSKSRPAHFVTARCAQSTRAPAAGLRSIVFGRLWGRRWRSQPRSCLRSLARFWTTAQPNCLLWNAATWRATVRWRC